MAAVIPFGIQTYRRADLPQIRLVNTYVEQVGNEAADTILLPRPALVKQSVIGTGPINGVFQQQGSLNGAVIAVSGTTAYNGATALGALDNTGLVQIVAADNGVLFATGSKLWRTDGTTLSSIAFPDDNNVSSIAYLGGYALASQAGSRHFYFTLDATTWDGLDYLSAEQSTEFVVGMSVLLDQLIVFCDRHTELFYLTGDSDAPLQRVQGRVFDKGARSRDTIVRLDNTVFWVGHDNVVYRAENTPIRVSDHGIEERLAASSSVSAWAYPWNGHLFYVLQMDDFTCAYDVATKQFHELASLSLSRWRGRVGLLTDSGILVGDDQSGQLWSMADGLYSEGATPIIREFTAIISSGGFLDAVTLDCSLGMTDAEGLIEVRSSRDKGMTWASWRQCGLGSKGQNRKRIGFKRFGLIDQEGMILSFRVTDAVPSRISRITANESGGGRSRPV